MQAWIKSSAPDVTLQVTISEVRPDGKETFVQNGWLRTTGRKLDRRRSTLLEPVPSLTQADDRPAARRPLDEGHRPALLPGARVPGRLADPHS